MEKRVLIVGCDKKMFNNVRQEYLKYGIFVELFDTTAQALHELSYIDNCLIIVIFSSDNSFLQELSLIRGYTKAPILIIKEEYNGMEKVAAIKAGADEYIQYPETISEGIASCYALVRRFTELNSGKQMKPAIFSRDSILINKDFRKVFVDTYEINMPRREFDLFYLLASEPGRVFTYEQLFNRVWKGDYIPTDNSLHSCVNRIRRKMEKVPDNPCMIENVRGVGYCFKQK